MRTLLKNLNSAPKFWILLIFFLISNSFAQIYDTPESRKILEAEKASKEAQHVKSISEPSFEEKENEAISYLGKTFRFIPGTRPLDPVRFYQEIPPSSRSLDPKIIFRPLVEVEFSVTGLLMPPPKVFPRGQDDFLLRIVFRDGKNGYVNIKGCLLTYV